MWLCSMPLHYSVDEKNINDPILGPPSEWSFHVLSMPAWVFSGHSVSSYILERWTRGDLECPHHPPSLSARVCVFLRWKGTLSGVGPALHSESQVRLRHLQP